MSENEGAQLVATGERLSRLFVLDEASIIAQVVQAVPRPIPETENSPVQLVPVHTFVLHSHTKDIRLARGILVPSFASHWGVVVGTPGEYTLYHLVLRPDEAPRNDKTGDSVRGKYREVKLHYIEWNDRGDQASMMKVGETRYSHEERIRIGINSFLCHFVVIC